MPTRERSRNFRREQAIRDKKKRRKPAGPRTPRSEAYDRNRRVNDRANLRDLGAWL